ncbi:MAG: hypothetical protein R2745_15920 [Vicinamibacterales bacterium]
MAKLRSEREVTCPCCGSVLVIDMNLGRVVSHTAPSSGHEAVLDDAHRVLQEQARRRDALFEESVQSERSRGDALSRRFEEALEQAKQEPITKPIRGFDLD